MPKNYFNMHKTTSGEKRKALELVKQSRAAMKAGGVLPPGRLQARELQQEAERLRAEAGALRDRAQLKNLSIRTMEKFKSSKKDSRANYYCMATWREGSHTRNVHLGSCAKMDAD